jgi:hypothetical protein
MTTEDKIQITGDVDLTDLTKSLRAELDDEASGIQLEPVPARDSKRVLLTVATLFAIAKGVGAVTPLILGILNYIKSRKKSGVADKTPRKLRIVAQDDSILELPEDTSAEHLKVLLENQPKFQNPKEIKVV